MVDHLSLQTNDRNRKKVAVLHFYFDYAERKAQNTEDFLRSLLKQVVYQLGDIPAIVEKAYDQWVTHGMSAEPERTSMFTLLENCFAKFTTVFVLIDAFDECNEKEQWKILKDLERLPLFQLRLFITGRSHVFESPTVRKFSQLKQWGQDANYQPISATSDDINKYLTKELAQYAEGSKEEHRTMIKEAISSQADGQYKYYLSSFSNIFRFLLAQFQLDHLMKFLKQPRMLSDELKKLPKSIDSAYNNVMVRIAEGGDPDMKFALKILSWIFYAADTTKPLQMEELQSLLVTEKGDHDLRDDELSSPADIITVCQSLVVFDKFSRVVSFTHFSVYEFLQKYRYRALLPISEMAKTCLAYLLFEEFEKGRSQDQHARRSRFKAGYYVANSWALYARKAQASPDVRDLVLQFLAFESKVESMWQMRDPDWFELFHSVNGNTVLHLLAENGLDTICSYVLVGRQSGIDKYVLCSPFDAHWR